MQLILQKENMRKIVLFISLFFVLSSCSVPKDTSGVWINKEKKYGTIKFKASLNGFKTGSTYEITFSCFENEKDNEKYLSLIIDLSKHIKDKSMGKSVNIPDLMGSDLEDSDMDE